MSYSYCLYLLVDDYSEYKCLCISKYDLGLIFIRNRNSPICDEYQTLAAKGFGQFIRICRHICCPMSFATMLKHELWTCLTFSFFRQMGRNHMPLISQFQIHFGSTCMQSYISYLLSIFMNLERLFLKK